jgi:hypothetical protein
MRPQELFRRPLFVCVPKLKINPMGIQILASAIFGLWLCLCLSATVAESIAPQAAGPIALLSNTPTPSPEPVHAMPVGGECEEHRLSTDDPLYTVFIFISFGLVCFGGLMSGLTVRGACVPVRMYWAFLCVEGWRAFSCYPPCPVHSRISNCVCVCLCLTHRWVLCQSKKLSSKC